MISDLRTQNEELRIGCGVPHQLCRLAMVGIAVAPMAVAACVGPPASDRVASASEYIFVWSGDPDSLDSDFLSVIDVDAASSTYGDVVATLAVGSSGGAHHSEHVMPDGGRLFVNAFGAGSSWVVNLTDPLAPFIEANFRNAGPYTHPHSFERTPTGTVLATFQYRGESAALPGALVELDSLGNMIRASDAADPTDPELRPYSLTIAPELDRVITTTSDMSMEHVGRSFQVWSLSELELLRTVLLPPGPHGDEHLNPAEPRFLEDGRTLIVTTFNCGMYVVRGVETDAPDVRHVYTLPQNVAEGEECGLPVQSGRFWVQTVENTESLVVFDLSDPDHPVVVDDFRPIDGGRPHWISKEPFGNRIVLTGGGTLTGQVMLLQIDPTTGALSHVDGFGDGSIPAAASMNRATWPHGATGPAIPHGAVFSRP